VRIAGFEESDFLGTRPSFQLRLAGKGFVHVVVRVPVEPADYFVSSGESIVVMEIYAEKYGCEDCL
jgi:hypothetical protein